MHEFAVIGAGLAGAAAVWQLAVRGHEVLVVDQFEPGHRKGSSHGSARIFRYAYPLRQYTDLVVQARSGWDELERTGGVRLITPTGSLDHGSLRNPRDLAGVLHASRVDCELLSARQAQERWPQYRFVTDVLWHPGAGVLDAESAVSTMLRLAEQTGFARLRPHWRVDRLDRIPGGYRLQHGDGTSVDAANIVVAVGAWLPALLGDLSLPAAFLTGFPELRVRQEQVAHFPYRHLGAPDPTGGCWPTFINKEPGLEVYGLPGGRDAHFQGLKIAEFNGGKVIGSAVEQDGIVDPAARLRVVEFAARMLPGVEPTAYAESTCLFTSTPSADFIVDRADRITVLSPCSGHGAKFAPLIGELAADLATGRGGVPDMFRIAAHAARFP